MDNLDWSLVPSFLAVADCGSLSAAARNLGTSQPTLGRHIKAFEASVGETLFQRRPRGLELTEAGAALVPAARAMAQAAGGLSLIAAGQAQSLAGPVRITASVFVCQYLLPPVIARIRRALPEIEIELDASDSSENLLFREADIALRMYRPTQLDVVTRHLGDLPLGLYAAKGYLARQGTPTDAAQLLDHALVGYDRNERILVTMRALGLEATRSNFPTRCDNQTVYWELVRAGCGIGACQTAVADNDPLVARVLPGLRVPSLPVWLTAHAALRQSPRIRRAWDFLASAMGEYHRAECLTHVGDSQAVRSLTQCGEPMRFAMAAPIDLRNDFDSVSLRRLAKRTRDATQSRRLLALAEVYDGGSRTDASRIGGVGLQIIRDWVLRFNARGPDGLVDGKSPGAPSKLNADHRRALAEVVEAGPVPAVDGVVRWRRKDLARWLLETFAISLDETTVGRELKALGFAKISARPRHYAQNELAVEALKKTSPPNWRRSGRGSRKASR